MDEDLYQKFSAENREALVLGSAARHALITTQEVPRVTVKPSGAEGCAPITSIDGHGIIDLDMKCGDPNNPAGPFIRANGLPCQRDVRPGFTRCNLHGGASPAAKIKAEQMMAQCRLPAIENLFSILEQFAGNTCATCGYPVGDADEKRMIIRACQTVLDRAGMGPHAILEIARQTDGDLNLDALLPEERGELLAHLAQIKEIKARVRARQSTVVANPSATVQ